MCIHISQWGLCSPAVSVCWMVCQLDYMKTNETWMEGRSRRKVDPETFDADFDKWLHFLQNCGTGCSLTFSLISQDIIHWSCRKKSGVVRRLVSMSEYNWLQALDMVRFNYGEAVMGGLKLTVMQGYRGIYWIIYLYWGIVVIWQSHILVFHSGASGFFHPDKHICTNKHPGGALN